MAGADRMAVEEVVRKVLVDEHADVLKESLRWLVAELMEMPTMSGCPFVAPLGAEPKASAPIAPATPAATAPPTFFKSRRRPNNLRSPIAVPPTR